MSFILLLKSHAIEMYNSFHVFTSIHSISYTTGVSVFNDLKEILCYGMDETRVINMKS